MLSESGEKDNPVILRSVPWGATLITCCDAKVRASITLKYEVCSEKVRRSTEFVCENLTTRLAPFCVLWNEFKTANLEPI